MSGMAEEPALSGMKQTVREVGQKYADRFQRARRLFVEERAAALSGRRDIEYDVKAQISRFFGIPYRAVCFAGSAQLGFSIHKDRPFAPAASDLDVACVDVSLFGAAWADIASTTRAFTDETKFSGLKRSEIELFKDGILRRGMIRIELMPRSDLSSRWQRFEQGLSRNYTRLFAKITCAIYISEYAFCWKQDAVLESFLG